MKLKTDKHDEILDKAFTKYFRTGYDQVPARVLCTVSRKYVTLRNSYNVLVRYTYTRTKSGFRLKECLVT